MLSLLIAQRRTGFGEGMLAIGEVAFVNVERLGAGMQLAPMPIQLIAALIERRLLLGKLALTPIGLLDLLLKHLAVLQQVLPLGLKLLLTMMNLLLVFVQTAGAPIKALPKLIKALLPLIKLAMATVQTAAEGAEALAASIGDACLLIELVDALTQRGTLPFEHPVLAVKRGTA